MAVTRGRDPGGQRRRRRDGAGVGPGRGPRAGQLTGHDGPVSSVAVTADGTRAVTGGDDGTVRVWDLAAGREQAPAHRPRRPVCGRWRSPRTGPARSAAARTARCGCGTWPRAPSRPCSPATTGEVRAVAVTADGTRAVTGGARRHGAGVGPGRRPRAGPAHRPRPAGCGRWRSPRTGPGRSAAAGRRRCGCGTWPPAASRPSSPATPATCRRWRSPRTATRAVSGGSDGPVRVWDLATGREQAQLTGHAGAVSAVAVTADGARAVTGGDDGTVRVWDLATGRQQAQLTGHDGGGSGRWRSPRTGPRWRSAAATEAAVRVWDLAGTGQRAGPLTGHAGPVGAVAVTADGARAVSGGGDGTVRVWDLAAGPRAGRPHRPRRLGAVGGGHRGRDPGGQRRRATGRCGCGIWPPAAELVALTGHAGRCAVGGGHRGRDPRGQRRQRRHGAGVGPGRRPRAGPAHRPRRPGAGGGGHRRRDPGGQRRRGRHGAGVGPTSGSEVARWTGEFPIIGCTALSGRPIKIGVGQKQGPAVRARAARGEQRHLTSTSPADHARRQLRPQPADRASPSQHGATKQWLGRLELGPLGRLEVAPP